MKIRLKIIGENAIGRDEKVHFFRANSEQLELTLVSGETQKIPMNKVISVQIIQREIKK